MTATLVLSSFLTAPPPATAALSLHDALPIYCGCPMAPAHEPLSRDTSMSPRFRISSASNNSPRKNAARRILPRSEEHTSELQSLRHLVCRLLLEKKNDRRERVITHGDRQARG